LFALIITPCFVISLPSTSITLLPFQTAVLKLLPENVSFAEEELDASISRITLNVPSSADLSFVLDLIESDQKYVQAKIENLNFDILKGYKLTLNLF